MVFKFNPLKHPGSGYVKVICDVCGSEFYRKDTVIIKDKWNTQNNLVVCKADRDRTNAQNIPYKVKEKIVTDPQHLRPPAPYKYATFAYDDRAPTAPMNVRIVPSPFGLGLILTWDGPTDPGSSGLINYTIQRSDLQSGTYEALASTIGPGLFYIDEDAVLDSSYSYIVAATNGAGTGPFSEPGYYPVKSEQPDMAFLVCSQDGAFLLTGDNANIIVT